MPCKKKKRKKRRKTHSVNAMTKIVGDTAKLAITAGVAAHITATTLTALKK